MRASPSASLPRLQDPLHPGAPGRRCFAMPSCLHSEPYRLGFREITVRAEDVTSVGAALRSCDSELLALSVLGGPGGWHPPASFRQSRAGKTLVRRVESALSVMEELAVGGDASQKTGDRSLRFNGRASGEDPACGGAAALPPDGESLVVPRFWFESKGGDVLLFRIGAALAPLAPGKDASPGCYVSVYDRDDVSLLLRVPSVDQLARLAASRSWDLAGCCSPVGFGMRALASEPWQATLARPLWLPASLGEAERHAVLADVFWAMTSRDGDDLAFSGVLGRAAAAQGESSRCYAAGGIAELLSLRCHADMLRSTGALHDKIRRRRPAPCRGPDETG